MLVSFRRAIALLAISGCVVPQFPPAEEESERPKIRIVMDANDLPQAIEAIGLPADRIKSMATRPSNDECRELLAICVAGESAGNAPPPLAGTYALDGAVLRFTPQFPFARGMRYRAALHPNNATKKTTASGAATARATTITREFTVPEAPAREPTELTQIFPSADTLPENLLRFYFHFSAPMSRGDVYQYMALLDERGRPVKLPFLELTEELWDPHGKRLTLLIDPGRIKQGLKPREDAGPVLTAGHEYTLVVDRAWPDATGQPLRETVRKAFRAAPPVALAIDTAQWQIDAPKPGTQTALVVRFPRPLDRALLERTLAVRDADGQSVDGRVTVSDHERRWEFRPERPWPAGPCRLVVDQTLEDPCGNRIGRPFEIDEWHPIERQPQSATVEVPFSVAGSTVAPPE